MLHILDQFFKTSRSKFTISFKFPFLFLICYCSFVNASAVHWFNEPAFQHILDEMTGSKPHFNNEVTLLINGKETFTKMMENIATADLILMKTFEFWDDETGNTILKQLLDKAKNGTKVFIQFDVKGINHSKDLNKIARGRKSPIPKHLRCFLEDSEGNGFLIPTSIPVNAWEKEVFFRIPFNHEKYLITWKNKEKIEPLRVVMGGSNTGDMYALGGVKDDEGNCKQVPFYLAEGFGGDAAFSLRDTNIEVTGTVTEDILTEYILAAESEIHNQNLFFQKYLQKGVQQAVNHLKNIQAEMKLHAIHVYPPNEGNALVRFIANPPGRGYKELNIHNFFVSMVEKMEADSLTRIAVSQFLPTKTLVKAMICAAKRGARFDILSNKSGGPEVGISLLALAARYCYRHILRLVPLNSLQFYDYCGDLSEGVKVMHQKVCTFGADELAPFTVGSCNMDIPSLRWNSEDILVIQSPALKKQVDAMLESDFSSPTAVRITLEELEQESYAKKLKEWILSKIFYFIME